MTELPLAGKAALVTAGATGIGFACARRLVQDGASVTIAARREEVLRDAADRLRQDAPDGVVVQYAVCDVSVEEQVVAMVARAAEPTGGLHAVVASAGVGSLGPVHKTGLDEWNGVLATNLTGTFLTFRHSAGLVVRSGGGALVAISSTAGAQVHRFLGAYGVSKAGVDMLVAYLADELGAHGVRVHSVRPGLVETEMLEIPMQVGGLVDDYLDQMPVRRVGRPEDVAELVRFLVGPESTWMTGGTHDIDGGMHLRRAADYRHLARGLFGDEATAELDQP